MQEPNATSSLYTMMTADPLTSDVLSSSMVTSSTKQQQQQQQQQKQQEKYKTAFLARREHRIRCAAFMKILLRYIERTGDELLLEQTKLQILQCTQQQKLVNRSMDSSQLLQYPSSPATLLGSLETNLRELVGDAIWSKSIAYTHLYFQQQASKGMMIRSIDSQKQEQQQVDVRTPNARRVIASLYQTKDSMSSIVKDMASV